MLRRDGNSEMIELSRAILCVNCNRISATTSRCRGCGSDAILHLERVLGRLEAGVQHRACCGDPGVVQYCQGPGFHQTDPMFSFLIQEEVCKH